MEIDIDVYFWMVDRGLFDDDQRNKVDMDRNKVRLHREHSQRFENAIYVAQLMLILKRSVVKISKKPFSLDPNLANLKDNITSTQKQMNWALVAKELKKFNIRVDGEKKAKILEGRTTLICDVLAKLFEFDNGGAPSSNRFQDGNISEINYIGGDKDQSYIDMPQNDSTNVSIDGKDSTSILLGAPISKKQELVPISSRGDVQNVKLPKLNQSSPQSSINSTGMVIVKSHNLNPPLNQSITSLNDLNENKDLGEAETTLEFILLSLSRNLGIKPKQVAGLLSNNHKYLIHIAVKGMKGNDYSKIKAWYKDIYSYTKTIVQLIDNEKEQNSMKLTMNILKCGLLSTDPELVINCGRVLSTIGQEINQIGGQLSGLAWEWFTDNSSVVGSGNKFNDMTLSEFIANDTIGKQMNDPQSTLPSINECGLSTCNYAIKKHNQDVLDHIAPILVHFGRNNYMELYTYHFKNQFQERFQFIQYAHDIVILMNGSSLFNDALYNSGVFDEWINYAIRLADFDGQNSLQERVSALAFLADVWEIKTDKSENTNDVAQAILTVFKRGCRDRSKILRTISFELLFKLLHQYSTNRNPFAPIIYKSLTFLLIEYHMDGEIRELLMKQFISLFQQIQTIPVAILCEPLLKQIEISANTSYEFNIYDFEFFQIAIQHKRSNTVICVQIVETMINLAISNIFYANSALSIILEAIHKFNKEPVLLQHISNTIRLQCNMLEDLEKQTNKANKDQKAIQDHRMKQLQDTLSKNATNRNLQRRLQEDEKNQLQADQQAYEAAQLARKTKERLIINLFKQLIMFGSEIIKEDIRTQLLFTYSKIEREIKVKSKGINYLLQLFGEDIPQMLQYFVESQKQLSNEFSRDFEHELDPFSPSKVYSNRKGELQTNDMNQLALPDESPKKKTKQDLHLEKALKEIEKIKTIKMERTDKKTLDEELKKVRDDQLKLQAKKVVEQRQIEHGVLPKQVRNYSLNKRKDLQNEQYQIKIIKPKDIDTSDISIIPYEEQRLIPYENSDQSRTIKENLGNPVLKQIKQFQLYDIRLEEQKDQDAVRFFVKKNMKIFRNLFNRYCNTSGPINKVNNSFDTLKAQNQLITVAEILKLLKDFQISTLQVGQKEVMQMFRLINMEILKKKDKGQATLTVLEFEGFVEFMLQLAVYIYSYEGEMTPSDYLSKLFEHFKKVAISQGNSLAKLFEDQSASGVVDNRMIAELNRRLSLNPNYQLPDGFQKVVEREISNVYSIPNYFPIQESQKVTIEVLDSFLNDLFGFHFLEPMSQVKEVSRARPVLRTLARDKIISELNVQQQNIIPNSSRSRPKNSKISSSVDINPIKQQRNLNITVDSNSKANLRSPREQIQQKVLIKPQLGVTLKLEVAKQKQQDRPHVLETAYVLEEILYSVQYDLSTLPPPNYFLINQQKQRIVNKITEDKLKQRDDAEKQKVLGKQKLEIRKKLLREQLEKMKSDKEKQRQEELEKKKELDAKNLQQKKKQEEKQKQDLDKLKEEWRKKQEEKEKEIEETKRNQKQKEIEDNEKKKKDVTVQLKERKKALMEHLRKKVDGRKASVQKEEDQKLQKEQKDKLKSQQIKQMYADNKQKAQEIKEKFKSEFIAFYESPEIQNLFIAYEKSLYSMFDLYSKFDSRDPGKLSYNSYVKMGQKGNIIPQILSSQDYIYIYKTIMRNRKQQEMNGNSDDLSGTKLNYNDFKEVLIKIACLGKYKLGGLQGGEDDIKLKEQRMKNKLKMALQGTMANKKKRANSSKASDSESKQEDLSYGIFEKEFDVQDMTSFTVETLFRTINLKPDKNITMNLQQDALNYTTIDQQNDQSYSLNNSELINANEQQDIQAEN